VVFGAGGKKSHFQVGVKKFRAICKKPAGSSRGAKSLMTVDPDEFARMVDRDGDGFGT
jgi:hypothetical protein